MPYDVVMGMEVHAHLRTRTKMFCACTWAFGAQPNSQVCPVCSGLPGVLPVMNREALELALRAAVATHCTVPDRMVWDRKSYYYPDMPKNYQISQDSINLGTDGYVAVSIPSGKKRVRIHNVHLEEDAGKLMHPQDTGGDFTGVDLNRAGVPLLEVVSQPDLADLDELGAYMEELRLILIYAGVSECRMERGELRYELSISLKPAGSTQLGDRVEVKNLNSTRAVMAVADYEVKRQTKVLDAGDTVARETRSYNDQTGRTERMRSKEEAQDYRYFPEPDLVPVTVDAAWLDRVRASIGELPDEKRDRFQQQHGLSFYDADVLTRSRVTADFFEETASACDDAKQAANWIINPLAAVLKERNAELAQCELAPDALAEVIQHVAAQRISAASGRTVLERLLDGAPSVAAVIDQDGLAMVSGADELETIIDRILADNPKAVADFKAGKKKSIGFLIGQVQRATKGKANPQTTRELLEAKIGKR